MVNERQLWGREELKKLEIEQRWEKTRLSEFPSSCTGKLVNCERPREEIRHRN